MTTDPLTTAIDATLTDFIVERVRAELKISELRTQSRDAEIAELKKAIEERDARIEQLLKALHGPTSERRSWASLDPEDQLFLEGMGLKLPENTPPVEQPAKDDKKEPPKRAPRSKNKTRWGPKAE